MFSSEERERETRDGWKGKGRKTWEEQKIPKLLFFLFLSVSRVIIIVMMKKIENDNNQSK